MRKLIGALKELQELDPTHTDEILDLMYGIAKEVRTEFRNVELIESTFIDYYTRYVRVPLDNELNATIDIKDDSKSWYMLYRSRKSEDITVCDVEPSELDFTRNSFISRAVTLLIEEAKRCSFELDMIGSEINLFYQRFGV